MTTDQQLELPADADARPIPPEVLAAREAAQQSLQRAKDAAWSTEAPDPIEASTTAPSAPSSRSSPASPTLAPNPPGPSTESSSASANHPDCWETRTDGIHSVRVFTDLLDDLWNAKQHYTRPDRYCEPVEDARDAVTIAEAIVALMQRDFLEWWGPINPPTHDDEETGEFAISEEEFRETFADVFNRPLDESP